MKQIMGNKIRIWIILAFFSLMGYSMEVHAAGKEVKGPYSAIRPLVLIYTDKAEAAEGINPQAKPAKGTLQTNNIEIYYQWQPQAALSVSRIQFYSSAPGKAYVRLYEAEAGRPGKLLAEARFKSERAGWQGIAFVQPAAVNAGQTYYLSYAHEKDIKDYVTTDPNSQAVPFYWNDFNFAEDIAEADEIIEAPVLTRVKAYESQIKLEWDAPANQGELNGYEVYRNGTLIGTTKHTYYVDEWTVMPEDSMFTYSIRAVKSDKLKSAFSNALSVNFQADEPEESTDDQAEPIQSPQPSLQDNGGVLDGGASPKPEPTTAPQGNGTAAPDKAEPGPTVTPAPAVVPDQELGNSGDSLISPPLVNTQAANANQKTRSYTNERIALTAVKFSVASGPAPPAPSMPAVSSKRRVLGKSAAPLKLSKTAAAELPSRQGVKK